MQQNTSLRRDSIYDTLQVGSPPPTLACPSCPRHFYSKGGCRKHIQVKHRANLSRLSPHASNLAPSPSPVPSSSHSTEFDVTPSPPSHPLDLNEDYIPPDLNEDYIPPDLNEDYIPPDLNEDYIPLDLNEDFPPDLNEDYIPPDLNEDYIPLDLNEDFPPDLNEGYIPPDLNEDFPPDLNEDYIPPDLNAGNELNEEQHAPQANSPSVKYTYHPKLNGK
jgi:hypothetical protein